jgi:hypothetical protein
MNKESHIVRLLSLMFAIMMSAVACPPALATVAVTPVAPRTVDVVTLDIANFFGSAQLTSETLTRVGNAISIQQTVMIGCALPGGVPLHSVIALGSLPPGTYTATLTVTFSTLNSVPGCPLSPVTPATVQ